jgi:hypothetical protein
MLLLIIINTVTKDYSVYKILLRARIMVIILRNNTNSTNNTIIIIIFIILMEARRAPARRLVRWIEIADTKLHLLG